MSDQYDERTREILERLEREFGARRREIGEEMRTDMGAEGLGAQGQGEDRYRPHFASIPQPPTPGRVVRLRLPLSAARVVYALLAINVVMYGVTVLFALLTAGAVGVRYDVAFTQVLYVLGAKEGDAIDAGQYWRFLTPIILHGGLIHLLFNSYALYALGPEAERIYGSARFLAAYLLGGLAGTIASYVRSPGLSIGASGAIFGLIGLLAVFFYVNRRLLGAEASRQQVTQLVSLAVINILIGLSAGGIIDNWAHIGGLAGGTLAGFALVPRYRVDDRLYPPVLVRSENPSVSWLLAGGLLAGMAALAMAVVGSR